MRRHANRLAGLLIAAVGVAEALTGTGFEGPAALDAVAIAATGGLVALRARAPVAVVWGLLGLYLVQTLLLTAPQQFGVGVIALLVLAFTAGDSLSGRGFWAWPIAYVAVMIVADVAWKATSAADDVFYPALGLLAFAAGRTTYRRSRLVAELARANDRLEQRRAAAGRRAVEEERRRIAHELHDVVAHSLSLMVVQAGGGRRVLPSDAERARQAAAEIERTGREALLEMRRLLGVLRRPDQPAERAPNPTLEALPALIDRLRATGLPVQLRVDGRPRELPAGLGLAAYRVVQDVLDDVGRIAPGARTTVILGWSPDALEIDVRDDRPEVPMAAGAGPALVGVRERVAAHGGLVRSGQLDGGGHEVAVRLPLHPSDSAPDPDLQPFRGAA